MKICQIIPDYPPSQYYDGVGDYTQKLCAEILKLGHEVTVLASYEYSGECISADKPFTVVPFASIWDFKAFLKLFKMCKNEKFDIVDLQYSPPLYGFMFKILYPFLGLRTTTAITLHTLFGKGLMNRFVAFFLTLSCKKVISTNEEINYLIKRYFPWRRKFSCIPIGSNISPVGQENRPRKNSGDEIVLTHFGLFYPGKGVETILKAVAELKKEYDNFRLLMIGGEWRGAEDYYHGLQRQAEELGLSEKISWLGFLAEERVSELLSGTDIYLIPFDMGISIRRGSYIVGLAHGVPIISTRSNIGSDYIKDGENIVLVPPKDSFALKEKILELVKNPSKREELGRNARALINKFSWPEIASETIKVFQEDAC